MCHLIMIVAILAGNRTSQAFENEDLLLPLKIMRCVENPKFKDTFAVDTATNPYYLRGDFDGDGALDYAVAVKGAKSHRNGVLICTAQGSPVLLGADSTSVFSDMPQDNFFGPNWEVASRADILEFKKTNKNVPLPRGEAILMIWEDGIRYIYWDGSRFRWSPLIQ